MTNKFKLLVLIIFFSLVSCGDKDDYLVIIHTAMGDMTVLLYDETPLHKKNFLELASSGRYDSTVWHRIINGFMVQGGNVYEKEGTVEPQEDRITAEIVPGLFHAKGALAAARMPDNINPERKSSACQFYIVQGKTYTAAELTIDQRGLNMGLNQLLQMPEYDSIYQRFIQVQMNKGSIEEINALAYSYAGLVEEKLGIRIRKEVAPEVVEAYTTVGGTPHLDNEYTVFGRVVEGLEVIDKLAAVRTAQENRPVEPLYLTMEISKVAKKEITEKYGYHYAEPKQ
ncbi:MAG: peptidylprolyl isomerase [Cyclobacteriaceae bacterium]|nr:peptidylprolyl isomerase [Cyclobacteriaceae bacterium]